MASRTFESLENHNYLRAVVYGIASDPAQASLAAPAKPSRAAGPTALEIMQEEFGRIDADLRLGLIDVEEAERRRAKARGNA